MDLIRHDRDSNGTSKVNTLHTGYDGVYNSYGLAYFKPSAWADSSNTLNLTNLYQGMRFDSDVGWYFTHTREYSLTMSVWNRHDEAGYIDGLNDYAFVMNNPLSHVDPFGLASGTVISLAPGEGGALLTAIASGSETALTNALSGIFVDLEVGECTQLARLLLAARTATIAQLTDILTEFFAEKNPKAPGKPTAADGYNPPRSGAGAKGERVKNPNGQGKGWVDCNGDVWVPTGPEESPTAHGGPHWDVQTPGGGHRNVYPGGKTR